MTDEVGRLIADAEVFARDVKSTFGELSAEELNWKPNVDEWSIAQCLEHLVITNNLYFENIQKVADGTHRNNIFSAIPFATAIIGVLMKKIMSPEWGKKMKTLKIFKPSFSEISENAVESFSENQDRFIALMTATMRLNVRKIKVAEPIGRAVNLRLLDAFEVLLVHEQRHFNQAVRVMEFAGFPKKGGA